MSLDFDVSTTTYVILESPSFHCNCFTELSRIGLITLYNLSMLETESKLCCGTAPFTAATVRILANAYGQGLHSLCWRILRAAHPVRHFKLRPFSVDELGMVFGELRQSLTTDCVKISPKYISINTQFCTKSCVLPVCAELCASTHTVKIVVKTRGVLSQTAT